MEEKLDLLEESLLALGEENCEHLGEALPRMTRKILDDNSMKPGMKARRLEVLLEDALIAHQFASEGLLNKIDKVLPKKDVERVDLEFEAYWVLRRRLCVWHGDITKLQVDAIVNAANDDGLGCFIPAHRCVDNVIHRAAGPRLRAECARLMDERGRGTLTAGSEPIVTQGYRLPAANVIHVTGPLVSGGGGEGVPTAKDAEMLAKSYEQCLDVALERGFRSIAFPCISTGLFGYPSSDAARVVVRAVMNWLESHNDADMLVILDVFANKDVRAYERALLAPSKPDDMQIASQWLKDADAVLICAGAGASGNKGELVYTNPDDFAKYYPWLLPFGYKTSYDCMGLMADPKVPDAYKRAYFFAHAMNQRFVFQPNPSYPELLSQLGDKDYFVYTSNVDGCFERAGFDKSKIYTPQGDWMWMQCEKPCRRDSYWPAKPVLDRVVPLVPDINEMPLCPVCHRKPAPNVRGGSYFTHAPHDAAQDAFLRWIDQQIDKKLCILEVGVGFNTPTVTRLPMEQICREFPRSKLVRVNPNDYEIPSDINKRALGLCKQWSAQLVTSLFSFDEKLRDNTNESQFPDSNAGGWSAYTFDWRSALASLRT